jgi:hypothetical protein
MKKEKDSKIVSAEKIKKNYKKIYNFFFKKLFFLIIIIISFIIISKTINKNITLDINDTFMIEKVKLK